MRIILVSCVIFFSCLTTVGQKTLKFSSQNYVGILEGQSATSFQLQSINGVRYKTLFTGIGIGLDYYYLRSIPLFISVTKFLSSEKKPLYFSGDVGINFPWEKNYVFNSSQRDHASPSLYWAAGIGYAFRFSKMSNRLLLNLGYSYKHMIQKERQVAPCLIPPCPEYIERYDYRLKRISLKAGWMF